MGSANFPPGTDDFGLEEAGGHPTLGTSGQDAVLALAGSREIQTNYQNLYSYKGDTTAGM